MANYKLYCLGHPTFEKDGNPVKFEMRKSLALLAYLRLADRDCSRESLATLLWPEYDQQHSFANLRRVLSSLRKTLESELLQADREKVFLSEQPKIWLDVEEFLSRISVVKNHFHDNDRPCVDCLCLLEESTHLYEGDFLEGLNLGDCAGFDEWQLLLRENLRQEFAWVLQKAAEEFQACSNWEQAIVYTRKWVALDRLHEPAQRFLMYLYGQTGQRSASLKQYDELVNLLQEELGQEPDSETKALYDRIRDVTAKPAHDRGSDYSGNFSSQFSEPLLKTKLYIPSSRKQNVHRHHIMHQLNQLEQYSLSILSAPAGFGKTTCLVEWASQSSLPVSWYSLDNGDNEIGRFLTYLIAAFESIQGGIGTKAQALLKTQPSASSPLILTHLIHDLEELATPSVLILDDYQFIKDEEVHNAVNFLLENLPPNVHLIIATRADPPLRLARFRSLGQLLEIRVQDLRFSIEEAYEYLTIIMSLPLTVDDIARLDKRIEGWVVGFQMAAIALQSRGPLFNRIELAEFIQSFSGSNRYILDYLTEEVLSRLPKIVYEFLLKTSILERLSSPICDAILDIKDDNFYLQNLSLMPGEMASIHFPYESNQQILEYLERSNLFVSALDNDRCWYRYHHLFADLLRARLQRLLGERDIAQLHIRACDWHERNGSTLEAIYHASMAEDNERVEHLIKKNYLEMVNRGEMSWLRFWTGNLSKELVQKRPWLCIYEAQNHAWFGELDEAEKLLDEAEKRIQGGSLTTDDMTMLGHLTYVRSRIIAMRGDNHRGIQYCLKAREMIPESNLALHLDINMTLGYEYFLNGDYVKASSCLGDTMRMSISNDSIINMVAAHCVMARLVSIQGQLRKSYEYYQSAANFIPEVSGQHLGAKALIEVGLAEAYYEWNDLQSACAHLEQGLALMPWWGKSDDFALAYLLQMKINLAQGDLDNAVESLNKAIQLTQTRGMFSEARNATEIAQVRLWLINCEIAKAAAWLEKSQIEKGDPLEVWCESKNIASIRVMIILRKFAEAQNLLTRLISSAEGDGRNHHLIKMLILQADLFHTTGQTQDALETLHRALSLSQPEKYLRVFLDEENIMHLLIHGNDLGFWLNKPIGDYINTLLAGFDGARVNI